ncbi:hypothetical protein PFICI_12447 [Pestalotiopsis fici W106-1]|uniref:Zn(2)-C6 fungal-type domain-containing protein n=1 Tax=Pestalotiopsis fici (strain W106-1 / CGMCC3.15140) TaxID=1229662 RepID=W3WNR6_PESFW|nr:uncharacterized protein PFICI_12447 [Pestalotiopsis fici W106-1]ETS75503.1 hypothetical protein PFICI_12447 [Pestalotiopsis fici W106-1]
MSQYAVTAAAATSVSNTAEDSAPPAAHHQQQQQQQSPGAQTESQPHPSQAGALPPVQHKRVYQACIPCRRRKVRCDLGSVDNPHEPPCVRCRRESKECYFSATRRKRKNDEDGEEDYIIRNGRKRHTLDGSPPPTYHRQSFSNVPLTPGGSTGRTQPLRRPDNERHDSKGSFSDIGEDASARLENLEAQTVMRREVYGPHDALDLLYKAATDHPHAHTPIESVPTSTSVQTKPQVPASSRPPRETAPNSRSTARRDVRSAEPIDPRLLPAANTREAEKAEIERRVDVSHEEGYEDALKAWGRFRFVRAGWFTREEAVKYVTYYYEFLSPMTPISPPTYRHPASHPILLTEEPILTVTLLTIASRYYQITTTGGHCRSHAIHEELWRYLRRMIERCLWGQEAFGGGFCGSGAANQTSSTAPERGLRKGSLRTLGTIESFMILTEWHPRALHFPPEEAIDELMLPTYDESLLAGEEDVHRHTANHIPGGGRRIEGWLEPAWRSDRMCWMLLSTAMALAYELGVFDNIDVVLAEITRPEYEDEGYRLRATRIKRLLMIYLTQLAGRLGWTNMVPESIRTTDPYHSGVRRPNSHEGNTPGTNISNISNVNYVPDIELDDQIIHCWVGISTAMHNGNQKLFRSHKHTTHIIQSGEYTTELQKFQPILKDWWKTFEQIRMPTFIRHILTIEYEYVRIYVNSLALQAVVERSTSNAGNPHNTLANFNSTMGLAPTQTQTQNLLGALPLGTLGGFGAEDQEFIKEVVNGCRNLLRTVVDGLLPGGYLKHAPVRTYFRIISGAMFLLKTFALGAPRSDVELSISLMDRTVAALRDCVVDDVHLGTRFGDLLESLTHRLRVRFKHAPTNGVGENSKAASVNGQSNGTDNGYAEHAMKLREGLLAPTDRSSTPALPISATPFDNSTGVFPYPTGSSSIFRPTTPATAGVDIPTVADTLFEQNEWNNPDDQMWYLPTGPGLFQTGDNANVTMTDQGVNIGGMDLLDFMTMDAAHFDSLNTGQF